MPYCIFAVRRPFPTPDDLITTQRLELPAAGHLTGILRRVEGWTLRTAAGSRALWHPSCVEHHIGTQAR